MSATARRDVFQAISDPVRREIIQLVAQGPRNLSAIGEQFGISRPAISNHIKILTECGMILVTRHGRERICEARLDGLQEVESWVQQYSRFWNTKFDSLDKFLKSKNKKNDKKQSTH